MKGRKGHKLCEASRVVRSIKTESRGVVARQRGMGRMGNSLLMCPWLQFGKMERNLKMDGGDGCTAM